MAGGGDADALSQDAAAVGLNADDAPVGTGQEALPFRNKLVDQTVLVMNPDYGARLQLQKIVMLDVADIVVVNKTDLERAKAALSEIEQRLTQNKRKQEIVATVAKRHRDPGVDELFELITKENT